MIEKKIFLNKILNESIDPDYFANVVSYYDDKIQSLKLDFQKEILTITYRGREDSLDKIIEEIKLKLNRDIINKKNQTIFSNTSSTYSTKENIWNKLKKNGIVYDFGNGHVSYSGLFLKLFNSIDSILLRIANKFNSISINFPNFIPINYLEKLGLVDEFPHYLFFISPLVKKAQIIDKFQNKNFSYNETLKNYLSYPNYCLKTAACLLLYPSIEKKVFENYTYFTMLGFCARHESFNVKSFERLTEFHQREIVFIGDESGVNEFFEFAIMLFKDLIRLFDLNGNISSANDSFFISNYKRYRLMQLLGNNKYEANVYISDTKSEIAFASFNNHHNFFSNRFNFSYKNHDTITACIGIGLERLVYGILCHHGLNETKIYNMVNNIQKNMISLLPRYKLNNNNWL